MNNGAGEGLVSSRKCLKIMCRVTLILKIVLLASKVGLDQRNLSSLHYLREKGNGELFFLPPPAGSKVLTAKTSATSTNKSAGKPMSRKDDSREVKAQVPEKT